MQEIEVLGLREPLRFGDALGESIPDMTASMAANGSRPACLASISAWPMRPNSRTLALIALPDALELLLMLVLGGIEQLAQDAVMQVDDFVGDGGHALDGERHQVA